MSSLQKKIAAKILKCGTGRLWIDPASEKVWSAITRRDIRSFIREGVIKKLPTFKHRKTTEKSQQRAGSRKGTSGARLGKKERWLHVVRPQRRMLKELRETKQLDPKAYRKLYRLIKGNAFRSKAHLTLYLNDKDLIKVKK